MIDESYKAKATQKGKTKTKLSGSNQCQLHATQISSADSDSGVHSATPTS